MPYRITFDGETVLDLRDREPFRLGDTHYPANHLQRGGIVPGYEVEHYEPAPPPPYVPDPASIALTPAQFFSAVDTMAGLIPADPANGIEGDPPADVWMQQQIEASTVLPPQDKRAALNLVRKATVFERSHPFMDVLGGAILGKTPAELDAAFLDTYQQTAPAP